MQQIWYYNLLANYGTHCCYGRYDLYSDYQVKLLMVGDIGVGKNAIMTQFTDVSVSCSDAVLAVRMQATVYVLNLYCVSMRQ